MAQQASETLAPAGSTEENLYVQKLNLIQAIDTDQKCKDFLDQLLEKKNQLTIQERVNLFVKAINQSPGLISLDQMTVFVQLLGTDQNFADQEIVIKNTDNSSIDFAKSGYRWKLTENFKNVINIKESDNSQLRGYIPYNQYENKSYHNFVNDSLVEIIKEGLDAGLEWDTENAFFKDLPIKLFEMGGGEFSEREKFKDDLFGKIDEATDAIGENFDKNKFNAIVLKFKDKTPEILTKYNLDLSNPDLDSFLNDNPLKYFECINNVIAYVKNTGKEISFLSDGNIQLVEVSDITRIKELFSSDKMNSDWEKRWKNLEKFCEVLCDRNRFLGVSYLENQLKTKQDLLQTLNNKLNTEGYKYDIYSAKLYKINLDNVSIIQKFSSENSTFTYNPTTSVLEFKVGDTIEKRFPLAYYDYQGDKLMLLDDVQHDLYEIPISEVNKISSLNKVIEKQMKPKTAGEFFEQVAGKNRLQLVSEDGEKALKVKAGDKTFKLTLDRGELLLNSQDDEYYYRITPKKDFFAMYFTEQLRNQLAETFSELSSINEGIINIFESPIFENATFGLDNISGAKLGDTITDFNRTNDIHTYTYKSQEFGLEFVLDISVAKANPDKLTPDFRKELQVYAGSKSEIAFPDENTTDSAASDLFPAGAKFDIESKNGTTYVTINGKKYEATMGTNKFKKDEDGLLTLDLTGNIEVKDVITSIKYTNEATREKITLNLTLPKNITEFNAINKQFLAGLSRGLRSHLALEVFEKSQAEAFFESKQPVIFGVNEASGEIAFLDGTRNIFATYDSNKQILTPTDESGVFVSREIMDKLRNELEFTSTSELEKTSWDKFINGKGFTEQTLDLFASYKRNTFITNVFTAPDGFIQIDFKNQNASGGDRQLYRYIFNPGIPVESGLFEVDAVGALQKKVQDLTKEQMNLVIKEAKLNYDNVAHASEVKRVLGDVNEAPEDFYEIFNNSESSSVHLFEKKLVVESKNGGKRQFEVIFRDGRWFKLKVEDEGEFFVDIEEIKTRNQNFIELNVYHAVTKGTFNREFSSSEWISYYDPKFFVGVDKDITDVCAAYVAAIKREAPLVLNNIRRQSTYFDIETLLTKIEQLEPTGTLSRKYVDELSSCLPMGPGKDLIFNGLIGKEDHDQLDAVTKIKEIGKILRDQINNQAAIEAQLGDLTTLTPQGLVDKARELMSNVYEANPLYFFGLTSIVGLAGAYLWNKTLIPLGENSSIKVWHAVALLGGGAMVNHAGVYVTKDKQSLLEYALNKKPGEKIAKTDTGWGEILSKMGPMGKGMEAGCLALGEIQFDSILEKFESARRDQSSIPITKRELDLTTLAYNTADGRLISDMDKNFLYRLIDQIVTESKDDVGILIEKYKGLSLTGALEAMMHEKEQIKNKSAHENIDDHEAKIATFGLSPESVRAPGYEGRWGSSLNRNSITEIKFAGDDKDEWREFDGDTAKIFAAGLLKDKFKTTIDLEKLVFDPNTGVWKLESFDLTPDNFNPADFGLDKNAKLFITFDRNNKPLFYAEPELKSPIDIQNLKNEFWQKKLASKIQEQYKDLIPETKLITFTDWDSIQSNNIQTEIGGAKINFKYDSATDKFTSEIKEIPKDSLFMGKLTENLKGKGLNAALESLKNSGIKLQMSEALIEWAKERTKDVLSLRWPQMVNKNDAWEKAIEKQGEAIIKDFQDAVLKQESLEDIKKVYQEMDQKIDKLKTFAEETKKMVESYKTKTETVPPDKYLESIRQLETLHYSDAYKAHYLRFSHKLLHSGLNDYKNSQTADIYSKVMEIFEEKTKAFKLKDTLEPEENAYIQYVADYLWTELYSLENMPKGLIQKYIDGVITLDKVSNLNVSQIPEYKNWTEAEGISPNEATENFGDFCRLFRLKNTSDLVYPNSIEGVGFVINFSDAIEFNSTESKEPFSLKVWRTLEANEQLKAWENLEYAFADQIAANNIEWKTIIDFKKNELLLKLNARITDGFISPISKDAFPNLLQTIINQEIIEPTKKAEELYNKIRTKASEEKRDPLTTLNFTDILRDMDPATVQKFFGELEAIDAPEIDGYSNIYEDFRKFIVFGDLDWQGLDFTRFDSRSWRMYEEVLEYYSGKIRAELPDINKINDEDLTQGYIEYLKSAIMAKLLIAERKRSSDWETVDARILKKELGIDDWDSDILGFRDWKEKNENTYKFRNSLNHKDSLFRGAKPEITEVSGQYTFNFKGLDIVINNPLNLPSSNQSFDVWLNAKNIDAFDINIDKFAEGMKEALRNSQLRGVENALSGLITRANPENLLDWLSLKGIGGGKLWRWEHIAKTKTKEIEEYYGYKLKNIKIDKTKSAKDQWTSLNTQLTNIKKEVDKMIKNLAIFAANKAGKWKPDYEVSFNEYIEAENELIGLNYGSDYHQDMAQMSFRSIANAEFEGVDISSESLHQKRRLFAEVFGEFTLGLEKSTLDDVQRKVYVTYISDWLEKKINAAQASDGKITQKEVDDIIEEAKTALKHYSDPQVQSEQLFINAENTIELNKKRIKARKQLESVKGALVNVLTNHKNHDDLKGKLSKLDEIMKGFDTAILAYTSDATLSQGAPQVNNTTFNDADIIKKVLKYFVKKEIEDVLLDKILQVSSSWLVFNHVVKNDFEEEIEKLIKAGSIENYR